MILSRTDYHAKAVVELLSKDREASYIYIRFGIDNSIGMTVAEAESLGEALILAATKALEMVHGSH